MRVQDFSRKQEMVEWETLADENWISRLPDRIRTRSDYRVFCYLDLLASGSTKRGPVSALRNPQLIQVRLLRSVEFWYSKSGWLAKCIRKLQSGKLQILSVLTGISIPPFVFGPGLSVAHYGSVVVNSGARVGAFCRIHSATNIGTDGTSAPTIGNFVYIAPGAVIYGGIHIGDSAIVGANSVVGRDVPGDCTVAGAPARVISQRGSDTIMPSWFPGPRSNRAM